jgi:hypothetical protein
MSKERQLKAGLFWVILMSVSMLSACTHLHIISGWASSSKTLLPVGNVCTKQNGGQISIDVPGSGKVIVTAQAMLGLKSHTKGEIDMIMLHIGASATDCTFDSALEGYNQMGFSIPKDEPSWTASVVRLIPVAVSRTFKVNSAGSKTYYLNGRRVSGSGNGYIWESSMQAVYYPDK